MIAKRHLIPAAVIAGQLALAAAIAVKGTPDPIPLHLNAAGEINHWGSRAEVARLVLFLAATNAVTSVGFVVAKRRGNGSGGTDLARNTTLFAISLFSLLAAAEAFGLIRAQIDVAHASLACLWLALAVVGGALGKIAPNPFVGVRTPWTRASRLSWDKSNRLAGRLLFWAGIVGLAAAPFAPEPAGLRASLAAVMAIAGLAVFESWRIWRTDPDRRPF